MDVTPLLLRYREAARHLWNSSLREPDDAAEALPVEGVLDDWEEVRQALFRALVLRSTGSAAHAEARLQWLTSFDFLRVRLSMETPALISRITGQGIFWDHPLRTLGPDDDLRFIDFFDFDEAGYRDFLYVQVEIRNSPSHPELAGHAALVEVQYVSVLAA
jgi:hypothetical protein